MKLAYWIELYVLDDDVWSNKLLAWSSKYNSKPVLFADDTSVIVSNSDLVNFKNGLTFSFEQLNAWLNKNLLSLNYDKTQYVHYRTNNSLIP
jgi:hypothetical protein